MPICNNINFIYFWKLFTRIVRMNRELWRWIIRIRRLGIWSIIISIYRHMLLVLIHMMTLLHHWTHICLFKHFMRYFSYVWVYLLFFNFMNRHLHFFLIWNWSSIVFLILLFIWIRITVLFFKLIKKLFF